jgi:hypothetical protein
VGLFVFLKLYGVGLFVFLKLYEIRPVSFFLGMNLARSCRGDARRLSSLGIHFLRTIMQTLYTGRGVATPT